MTHPQAAATATAGRRSGALLTPGALRAFMAFVILAVVVWVAIGVGANARAPGAVGLAATLFGGVLAAILLVAIGGWIALKLAAMRSATPFAKVPAGAEPELAAVLADLEIAQAPAALQLAERAAWRTPACAAAGAALWSVAVMLGAAGGVLDFSAVLTGGGLLGLAWARYQAAGELGAVYLDTGVGGLARRVAGLVWRTEASLDFRTLQNESVLPRGDIARTGELAGVIHGVNVRIVPAKQEVDRQPTGMASGFTGIVIELEGGAQPASSMEDLAARNPRLMVRIGQLASLAGLATPRSAATGARVSIAVPETSKPRLFDPPMRLGAEAAAPRLERLRVFLLTVAAIAEVMAEPAPPAA